MWVQKDKDKYGYFFELFQEHEKCAGVVLSNSYDVVEKIDNEDRVKKNVVKSEYHRCGVISVELNVLLL